MPIDNLKDITIDELLRSPVGEWIGKAMETVSTVQRTLFVLSQSNDDTQFTLLKIGTVFQIFLIDTLATGKKPEDFTKQDWKNIAEKVSRYAVIGDEQSYSVFVFMLYADYIDVSADALMAKGVENAASVKDIAEEIREYTTQLQRGDISEVDYVEKCLWLSLEAMIKCLSLSLTPLIGPEFTQLAQATAQLAFEYGRYVLYAKEQAILEEYIANQYALDRKLQLQYDAYLGEVRKNAERFQTLIDAAFSTDLHEALVQSAALARAYGVCDEDLLDSIDDVDDFFLK